MFWEEGNPKARLSPDAYVVFGVPNHLRDSYKSWEEGGRLPDVVFEFTSRKTQREDTDTKLPRYETTLRTPEYFLFDPTGDYLRPRLQGYRLESGRYVRLELVDDRLHSERLGLDLVQEGEICACLTRLKTSSYSRHWSRPTAPREQTDTAPSLPRKKLRGCGRELDALRNKEL